MKRMTAVLDPGPGRSIIKNACCAGALLLSAAAPALALEYDCMMEPHNIVDVMGSIDGRIEQISVERSDVVKKDEPLIVFESDIERSTVEVARAKVDMEAAVDSSRVSHKFALRKLDRFKGLSEKGVLAEQTRDEVETEAALARLQIQQALENRKLARLELRRAQALLKQHTVRSPFDGVVVERFKSVGEFAGDSPILQLAQLDPLNIEVMLPASRFGSIEPGMQALVIPEPPLEGSYPATVTVVDRVVDASSGTFGVRLELPNPDNQLPGGLRCSISFDQSDVAQVTGR